MIKESLKRLFNRIVRNQNQLISKTVFFFYGLKRYWEDID